VDATCLQAQSQPISQSPTGSAIIVTPNSFQHADSGRHSVRRLRQQDRQLLADDMGLELL
jgi:phosphatidylserine decarboxylase